MGKIKQFLESEKGKDILVIVIIILVGLGAFELGRLSKESKNSGIEIEYLNQTGTQANVVSATNSATNTAPVSSRKNFFASNRGSKYYPVGCAGGKNIKQENKIYFVTSEEAEGAGYELSDTCR